jgi:carbon monoxide dehydrogenase subunit G
MQMAGEYRIPAAREIVWRGLNDPDVLKQCIPGCETVEQVSDTEFTARVALAVGPVKAKFTGRVTLSELVPPESYTISGEGQGGVAGFGKGSAKVRLDAVTPAETLLRYEAQSTVGGKLAQVGSRLVDATAKKLADEFFSRFANVIGQPAVGTPLAAVPEAAGAPAASAPEPIATATPPARPAVSPIIWVPALIIAIGVLLWAVTR